MFSLEFALALALADIWRDIQEDLRDSSVSGGSFDSVLGTTEVHQERLQLDHFLLQAVLLHHGSRDGGEGGEGDGEHQQQVHGDVRMVTVSRN